MRATLIRLRMAMARTRHGRAVQGAGLTGATRGCYTIRSDGSSEKRGWSISGCHRSAAMPPAPVRRRRLSEHVAEQILGLIRAQRLRPGDLLPTETELM